MTLREYLERNNLSPDRFAHQIGVHPTTIWRLLNGATIPKRHNLKRIMEATNGEVDISDLMQAVMPQTETEAT